LRGCRRGGLAGARGWHISGALLKARRDVALDHSSRGRDLTDLLRATAGGNTRALAQLYGLAAPRLHRYLLHFLRREDWAQEALQDVFLSVWNHAREYTSDRSSPMTWMYRIARNRALDCLSRAHRELAGADSPLLESVPDEDPLPDVRVMQDQQARRLLECLRCLPEAQRLCISLAYMKGLTHSEIARRLHAPLGSVKTWLRRGLASLRHSVADVQPAPQPEAAARLPAARPLRRA